MELEERKSNLISRYLILLFFAVAGFDFFYFIFLPLTKYPVYFILSLFFDTSLIGNSILIGEKSVEIIGACIGGAAYLLLLILNLATPKINFGKRAAMIMISFGAFWFVNLLRIILLTFMYLNNSPFFGIAHEFLWYFGSTIFVVGVWFVEVYSFRIKEIPFYSDLRELYLISIFKRKKSKSSKKKNNSRKKNS